MKSVTTLYLKIIIAIIIATVISYSATAQQPISSIVTSNIVNSPVTKNNIKGAGLHNTSSLFSSWDSIGSSFTMNYNVSSMANVLRVSQFSVAGFSSSLLTIPASAIVKIRHATNTDIGDARVHYNFWAKYSAIPAVGATSGTFDFIAPEVVNPENAFLLNNLTSGYDNIFQNSVNSPHFSNIERVDFIVPAGVKCYTSTDLTQSGIAVIDRGAGDPFKIAAITAIDGNNTPTAFGNLVSVTAANFGPDLLPSTFNYIILINDSKYYSQSRPSAAATQNLRGVYISLADLGLVVNQTFYGYALFGPDVTTAAADWTTYPSNSDNGSQLDPVGIMGLYKSVNSVLPMTIGFTAVRDNKTARLQFTLYNKFTGDRMMVQRSVDGTNFIDIDKLNIGDAGSYSYIHHSPAPGINYYRLKMIEADRSVNYSEIRSVKFEELNAGVKIFPNPAVEKLTISFPSTLPQGAVTAEIFTTSGDLVKRIVFKTPGNLQSIPVNTFPKGRYMLRLTDAKEQLLCIQNFTVL
ncbi:MAG: T9SS type A sorting domain-containing protein [Chitinophagaceae bacterium]